METNSKSDSKEKKEMLGKTIGGVAGAAAFVATTSIAIDVMGDDSVDELVAINAPEDMGGPTAAAEEQLAYEAHADVGDISEADLEMVDATPEGVSAVQVHTASEPSDSYLASADVEFDTGGLDDVLASADTGDMGILGDMIDAVNDLV